MAQIEDSVTTSHEPSSRRIRADIDRTRAEMDKTVDAIEDKLTPGQLLQEAWGIFRGGSTAGASRLLRVAKEYPLPAAVIGLGFGLMMYESSNREDRSKSRGRRRKLDNGYDDESWESGEPGRLRSAAHAVSGAARSAKETAGSAVHKAGELAGEAGGKVKDLAGQAGEAASHLADQTGEKVSELAGSVRERASELGSRTREGVQQARSGFWRTLEERPLAVGAATLAAGVLAGLAMPSTHKEDELMGETRDHLLEEAKDLGREALEKGKQVATVAADTLKHEVEQQGLTPEGIAEKVRAVGREVKETAKNEAKNQNLTPEAVAERAREAGREAKDEVKEKVGELEPELAKR